MANHDPRPLLEEILKLLKENKIEDNLQEIRNSLKKPLTVPPHSKHIRYKIFEFMKVLFKDFFAPSIFISIVIFAINFDNQKRNSPLEYSLEQKESVGKLISSNDDIFFTTTPFSNFQLRRNNGGQLKNLFLVVMDKEGNPKVYSPIINDSYTDPYNDLQKVTLYGEPVIIWNTSNNVVGICLTDIYLDMERTKVGSAFLIVKGVNGSYSVITLLHKIGKKSEDYIDVTLSFTDLEIYDKRVWKERIPSSSYNFFITEYDTVTKNYQTVISWLKETTLTP